MRNLLFTVFIFILITLQSCVTTTAVVAYKSLKSKDIRIGMTESEFIKKAKTEKIIEADEIHTTYRIGINTYRYYRFENMILVNISSEKSIDLKTEHTININ